MTLDIQTPEINVQHDSEKPLDSIPEQNFLPSITHNNIYSQSFAT